MRRPLIAAAAVLIVIASLVVMRMRATPDATPVPPPAQAAAPQPDSAASAAQDLDDATIVAIFDMANTNDAETGALAVQRGQHPEVRAFGEMLVRDHHGARQLGRDLAKKLGVTPTPPPEGPFSLKHKAAMKMLREVPTAEFDQAFLKHEASYHAEVIQLVTETLLPAIVNAELKALVVKVSPAFEAHRVGAEALAKRLADSRR